MLSVIWEIFISFFVISVFSKMNICIFKKCQEGKPQQNEWIREG